MFVGFLFCFAKGDVLSDQFVGRRVCGRGRCKRWCRGRDGCRGRGGCKEEEVRSQYKVEGGQVR